MTPEQLHEGFLHCAREYLDLGCEFEARLAMQHADDVLAGHAAPESLRPEALPDDEVSSALRRDGSDVAGLVKELG